MVNTVTISGKICNIKKLPNLTSFSLNVAENRKGEWKYFFISCVAFGKAKTSIEHIADKQIVMVSGKLIVNAYTNKDGIQIQQTKIMANVIAAIGQDKLDTALSQAPFESEITSDWGHDDEINF